MRWLLPLSIAAATMLGLSAGASAQYYGSQRYARPYYLDRAPGWEVRERAARAQREPGLTSELAPDAVQSATGGPSGGVPGFSGH